MFRSWSLPLAAALLALALTPAVQGQGRGGAQVQLPDGPAKQIVSANCASCHGLNNIVGATGYTKEGWRSLITTMVKMSDADTAAVTEYLATHFPPKPGREPKLVAGDVSVTFKEWIVPTLGQRSRDPIQTADGMIWWNGQFISLVGRLNPNTGEMKEWKLDPTSKPHSITPDKDGNIWYTGNANGTIGKLVPSTGEITVYKMPDPAARDPHTAIFNKDGNLFFTLQGAGMVGRLIPSTGEIKLVKLPTENARPYGIKKSSKGEIWFSYNSAPGKLGKMDPVTMAVTEYAIPDPKSTSRRLALLSDDTVFYVNSALGRLGRLNPKTGEFKEWPSPSGPRSHPYAIEVIDDIVWYNESGQRPDALVRFDPKTEKFQSWAIPSGVGIIRHMRKTPEGNLAIHQTSSNRIGLAIIGKSSTSTSARR